MNKKYQKIILLILNGIGLALLLYLIFHTLWVKKQESINVTLDQIITGLQDSGFVLENIEYVNDLYAGYFGMIKNGVFITVKNRDEKYKVMIEKMDSWESARSAYVISTNRGQYSVFGLSFYYGDIFINIFPPDEHFKDELNKLIKEICERMSK